MAAKCQILCVIILIGCASGPIERPYVDVCAGGCDRQVAASLWMFGAACGFASIDFEDREDGLHGRYTETLLNVWSLDDAAPCSCSSANIVVMDAAWNVEVRRPASVTSWSLERKANIIKTGLVEVTWRGAAGDVETRYAFTDMLTHAKVGARDDVICAWAALELPARAHTEPLLGSAAH